MLSDLIQRNAILGRCYEQGDIIELEANQPFDEVYISAFRVGDQDYYAEHNDLLTDAEITQIESKIKSD